MSLIVRSKIRSYRVINNILMLRVKTGDQEWASTYAPKETIAFFYCLILLGYFYRCAESALVYIVLSSHILFSHASQYNTNLSGHISFKFLPDA